MSYGSTAFHDETQRGSRGMRLPRCGMGRVMPDPFWPCVRHRVACLTQSRWWWQKGGGGVTLVVRHAGGGMRLTTRGKDVVTNYRQFRRQVDLGVERQFTRTFRG